jgi:FdhE protein
MEVSDRDQQVLRALAEARDKHEELVDLLDFYRDLWEVQFQAKAQLPTPQAQDSGAMQRRLESGKPLLTFRDLPLEGKSFAALVSGITQVLLRHNPGWQAEPDTWEQADLIAWARIAFEDWETLTDPKSDGQATQESAPGMSRAAGLAVAFALAPYLQRAAQAILPGVDLVAWARGYCPLCGGQPNLALLESTRGARQLICSRCDSRWDYSRVGCPFCQSQEKQTYYRSDDGVYRLYVCSACHRYLKTVDQRELYRPVYPEVERLLTVGMDLAAKREELDL